MLDVCVRAHSRAAGIGAHAARNILTPEDRKRSRDGLCGPPVVPRAQHGDLIGQLLLERIRRGRVVIRPEQRRDHPLERRQVAVVCRGDQRAQRKVLSPRQDLQRVIAARTLLLAGLHVAREVFLPLAARTRGRPRPVVRVVDESTGRIQEQRALLHREQALPFGRWVAAIHRLRPVEPRITLGYEVSVEIGDVAVRVREDRVVRRVGVQFHRLRERLIVLLLRARVRLRERFYLLLHHLHRHPLAVGLSHDRAVTAVVDGEILLRHSGRGLVRHADRDGGQRALAGAVLVHVAVALLRHGLGVIALVVHAARGVHPSGALVEALVDEELSPRHRAVGVQPFVARDLHFGAEKERSVRVDQQQRVVVQRVRRRDRDAVRARRFLVEVLIVRRRRLARRRAAAVHRCELIEVHLLDVAADAPLAEGERHPGFELPDDARLHLGMLVQVEIQAVGPRDHELLQPRGTAGVLRLHRVRIDEELHPQVAIDLLLTLGLRKPPHRIDEIRLDAVEIVLRLLVDQAEHSVRVRLPVDVGDSPVIAGDRDALRLLLPGRNVRRSLRARTRDERESENENELLHVCTIVEM